MPKKPDQKKQYKQALDELRAEITNAIGKVKGKAPGNIPVILAMPQGDAVPIAFTDRQLRLIDTACEIAEKTEA